ncbi:MAG: large conductance mechanosensitive channel protein MscL [Actinobacteria bacterium]|nr:large conductance mechanosensitive channel protein MscL [Actinomycetota bacterium]
MLQGFKEFITRGNAIDLAVGVIIGGAFAPIVAAVTAVIMGIIGGLFGQPNFDQVGSFMVNDAEILPGAIVTAIINFLIVAAALYFFVVVPMNKLAARRKEENTEPEAPAEDVRVLTEIRDLLAAR